MIFGVAFPDWDSRAGTSTGDSGIRLRAVNTVARDSRQMLSIDNALIRPSRIPLREGRSLFQAAAAGLRLALNWRASRRREMMATIEKYRLLAEEFRSRAEQPNLEAQRREMLAYATHFERCATDIMRANAIVFH